MPDLSVWSNFLGILYFISTIPKTKNSGTILNTAFQTFSKCFRRVPLKLNTYM